MRGGYPPQDRRTKESATIRTLTPRVTERTARCAHSKSATRTALQNSFTRAHAAPAN